MRKCSKFLFFSYYFPTLILLFYCNNRAKKVKYTEVNDSEVDANFYYTQGLCFSSKVPYNYVINKRNVGLLKAAFNCYSTAAKQGHVGARYKLADCYTLGRGTKIDCKLSFKLIKELYDTGDDTEACLIVAIAGCYLYGDGVDKDPKEAFKYFSLVAEQGNAKAQTYVGQCYLYGAGVDKDDKEAFKYFSLAAEQGNANAQFQVGKCYAHGWGVDKDPKKAFTYLSLAADQGYADAQYKITFT